MTVKWNQSQNAQIRQAAMRGVIAGTEAVRTTAVDAIFDPPKTGRVYKRRDIIHQASAPGQAPAHDLGGLSGSIDTIYDHARLMGTVNAGIKYAAALEFGTTDHRIKPRPFMRPALAKNLPNIEGLVAAEIRGVL